MYSVLLGITVFYRKYSQFVNIQETDKAPSNYGVEKALSTELTYTIKLPDDIKLTDAEAIALQRGVNEVDNKQIIRAEEYGSGSPTPTVKKVSYNPEKREIGVTVYYEDYLVGHVPYVCFTLQMNDPVENTKYELPFRVSGKVQLAFGDVKEMKEVSGTLAVYTGYENITPYITIETNSSSYDTPKGYFGQTYQVTVGVKNETLYDYKDKLQYVAFKPFCKDNYWDYTYLSSTDLESVFNPDGKQSTFWPVVTITNAELCQIIPPAQVTLADGTQPGTVTLQYSSADAANKYTTPVSTSHGTAITTNAKITIEYTQDKNNVQMTCEYSGGQSKTEICAPNAQAMQQVLDRWGYVVTLNSRTNVTWSYSADKSQTGTVEKNTDLQIAVFTVSVKDAFMEEDRDTEQSVGKDPYVGCKGTLCT